MLRRLVALAVVVALSACGGGDGCDPTSPTCVQSGIAVVQVTSPVDSVMAVGSIVQLDAVALNAAGRSVAASFTWSSSAPSVVGVSNSGLASASTGGAARLSAQAGGVSGTYDMRAVEADLPAVAVTLADPAFVAASLALGSSTESALASALDACDEGLLTSDVLGIESCLDTGAGIDGIDGNDDALLGFLGLFFAHARGLLKLGR